jgi:hypothetical protein
VPDDYRFKMIEDAVAEMRATMVPRLELQRDYVSRHEAEDENEHTLAKIVAIAAGLQGIADVAILVVTLLHR